MPTIEMNWLGQRITTLPDYLRPGLKAVFVGINPATTSVSAGHYYQGTLGIRFWNRLIEFGIVDKLQRGREDESLFLLGFGLTDVVKKPSGSAGDLQHQDYEHGTPLLVKKLSDAAPCVVCFTFAKAANAAELALEKAGLDTFRMPGPYERRNIVEQQMGVLAELIRRMD